MLHFKRNSSRLEFVKITVHPLFIAVGLLSALFGGLPIFVIYTLTALIHECGHIFCAHRMGFVCSRIRLTPYGASAVCEIDGISPSDEVKLALAGPLVNAALCVALAGLWWFYPVTYAYTDILMQANAVMLAVNLLPAYPLDGGRVARCALTKLFSARTANIIMRCAAVLFAGAFAALFFLTDLGFTCIMFGAFLVLSAFEKPPQAAKINFATPEKKRRGLEIKYIFTDENLTYREAVRFLDDKKYVIFRAGGREVTQDELYLGFVSRGIYDRVFEIQDEAPAVGEDG